MSQYPMPPAGQGDQSDPFGETAAPVVAGTGSSSTSEFTVTPQETSTKDVAKEQAAGVKDSAAQAGQQVAGVAKEQAASVASEAGQQAKNLLHQSRSELQGQAAQQQQRVASGLRSLSEELQGMASGQASQQPGLAADLARQAADRTTAVASWLEDREPGAILDELRSFARQRPGVFLAAAAGAGLLAGRLTRSLQAGPVESGSQGSAVGSYPPPAAGYTTTTVDTTPTYTDLRTGAMPGGEPTWDTPLAAPGTESQTRYRSDIAP